VLTFGSTFAQLSESELSYIDSIKEKITEDTPDTVSLSIYNQISDISSRYARRRCIETSGLIDSICEIRLKTELTKKGILLPSFLFRALEKQNLFTKVNRFFVITNYWGSVALIRSKVKETTFEVKTQEACSNTIVTQKQ
jgi:hypothetical protein